eukprot:TRINITY_DN26014_c0_g5_i2.p3 TRINITY_DN26014_c0_g5~~TRINITY_DN26014_c0_g5_i2.p3  ORF type:complete len:101 (-),score=12.48 TRINITY_DN26014_c0_g5_i2:58-360(-)
MRRWSIAACFDEAQSDGPSKTEVDSWRRSSSAAAGTAGGTFSLPNVALSKSPPQASSGPTSGRTSAEPRSPPGSWPQSPPGTTTVQVDGHNVQQVRTLST